MRIALSGVEEKLDSAFARRVIETSGANLARCYQCFTCSAGCPIAYAMDYPPNRIIRMIQFGLKDTVLNSATVWLCASCETCATRCPNEIDVVRVMDTLRQMAIAEGYKEKGREVISFHSSFLDGIRKWGRVHELMMIMGYMLSSGQAFRPNKKLFADLLLGMKMFLKGKLALVPHRTKGQKEVELIFKNVEKAGLGGRARS